jgi:hypothetical protein
VSATFEAVAATATRRDRPLLLKRGSLELVLPAADANMLLDAIDRLVAGMRNGRWEDEQPGVVEALDAHIGRLYELADLLVRASSSLVEPPLKIDRRVGRLLRDVLADMRGYQRLDLTTPLQDLRRMLEH